MGLMVKQKSIMRPRILNHRFNNINSNWLMELKVSSRKMDLFIKIQILKRNPKV
jgi:hypothetical protein